jgi:hypothetical protein
MRKSQSQPVKLTLDEGQTKGHIMAILNDCILFHAKLSRPSNRFDKENPSWELQIRTTSKDVAADWRALGLKTTAVVDDDTGDVYYRSNLKKKSKSKDGQTREGPEVVDAGLNPIDGKNVGNGSVGNVKISQYEYTDATGAAKKASVLMGVQLTKLVFFEPVAGDSFAAVGKTTVIHPEKAADAAPGDADDGDHDDNDDGDAPDLNREVAVSPKMSPPKSPPKTDDGY